MTRKSKARYGLKRTYKLNPTVKALRNALMAGMMVAAISPSAVIARDVSIDISQFPGIYYYNSDNLYAYDGDIAAGIVAVSFAEGVEIVNTGDITAEVYSTYGGWTGAAGIYALGSYGSVVDNSGDITVINNTVAYGSANAWGIFAGDFGGAAADVSSVYNTGNISVSSYISSGYANAFGIQVLGAYEATIENFGDITISSISGDGVATAYGLEADSLVGDASIYNYADIDVSAISQDGNATATGINAQAYDYAYVYNIGDITVSASVEGSYGEGTTSTAIGINADGDYVNVYNAGDISITTDNNNYLGTSVAIGISVESTNGLVISNYGDITIEASSGGGAVTPYWVYPGYSVCGEYWCYVKDAGTIEVVGIQAESEFGDITINNTGSITITDLNPDGGFLGNIGNGDYINGIEAFSNMGDVAVTNSGDIVLEGGKFDIGILAQTGTTYGFKSTYIDYYSWNGYHYIGYYDLPYFFGGGDVSVVNTGNITITSGVIHPDGWLNYRASVGIAATTDVCGPVVYWLDDSTCGGDVSVVNTGLLNISNTGSGGAVGIETYALGNYGEIYVANSGELTIYGTEFATGINANADGGDSYVINTGNITTTTNTVGKEGRAIGINVFSGGGDSTVINTGDIKSYGDIAGGGIRAGSLVGDVLLVNSGDITAESTAYYTLYNYYSGESYALGGNAFGLRATTAIGTSTTANTGDIDVYGVINAYGIINSGFYSSSITYNAGDITASNSDNDYAGNVYGIVSRSSGRTEFLYGETGTNYIGNSGDISISSGSVGVGIFADSVYGNIIIENTGDIAIDAYGVGHGIDGFNIYGNVSILNAGDINIDAGSSAIGIAADTFGADYYYNYYPGDVFPGNIFIASAGNLSISSSGGRAIGITGNSYYGDVGIYASGDIDVSGYDRSTGLQSSSFYGNTIIYSEANLTVNSSNEYARGIYANTAYGDVLIFNAGNIDVSGSSLTQGISAKSYYGEIVIINNGDISANSSGYSNAIAVNTGLYGYGALVVNNGSLEATGANAWTVNAVGGDLTLLNYGSIFGSMITDWGNDYIYNAEGASIYMDNSSILLGYGYNTFMNNGELFVNGSNNLIDMGTNYSESSANTFYNYGNSIHMDDGAPDDALTIIGNFAGTGSIFVDVDGLSLTSDRLYIEGDVVPGTANTVDVNLMSMPSASDVVNGTTIPIVTVSGANTAGNFVLGNVALDNTAFFTADYSLVRETPTTDFSLAFEVTGLTTAGALLATVSPAMQNLWFSSVGTMYQRQGAERSFDDESGQVAANGAAGAWLRLYGSNGSMAPDASVNHVSYDGSQNFDLNSNGIEAGFGYSFNNAWTIGLLGGINQGDYKPDVGGKVSLDGNTWGGYVTFTPGNGFYADLSYRDISFDGYTLNSGVKETLDGSADGFSLEMGYGFKMQSGLEVEPQLQYSDMSSDFNTVQNTSGDFELTDGDASQLRLGVALRKSFNQDSGVWTPYGALSFVQDSSGSNDYLIGGALKGQVDTSGSSALLEIGTDARYGNFVVNVGLNWQDGGAYDFVFSGQLNMRYSW